MQHYKANEPKALKMYSTFIREILNNKEKSKEIIGLSNKSPDQEQENFEIEYDDDFTVGKTIMYCSSELVLLTTLIILNYEDLNILLILGVIWYNR